MTDTINSVREWLESVAAGASTMSQRKLERLTALPGGLDRVRELALGASVHLVVLTDDRGVELVAASRHPFKVIC